MLTLQTYHPGQAPIPLLLLLLLLLHGILLALGSVVEVADSNCRSSTLIQGELALPEAPTNMGIHSPQVLDTDEHGCLFIRLQFIDWEQSTAFKTVVYVAIALVAALVALVVEEVPAEDNTLTSDSAS